VWFQAKSLSVVLRKTLVNDRVAGDDFLIGSALWHYSPRVFMRMCGATVSLKTKVCY